MSVFLNIVPSRQHSQLSIFKSDMPKDLESGMTPETLQKIGLCRFTPARLIHHQ